MNCSQILNEPWTKTEDPPISHFTQDSRQVRQGSLFFCHGSGEEAKRQIAEARAKGAAMIVCTPMELDEQDDIIFSPDPRRAYSLTCQRIWDEPQKDMTLIAVTGTNGKSSVAWQLRWILEQCGRPCGLIGSIVYCWQDQKRRAVYTTPDAAILYPLLRQMKDAGCTHVVMEASSQALSQQRLAGLTFDLGIFTNLSREHLDQHGNMEAYFAAKKSLFAHCRRTLCNADDPYGRRLRGEGALSYSLSDPTAEYTAYQRSSDKQGNRFCIVGRQQIARIQLELPGVFPASNAMAVLAAAEQLGISLEQAAEKLASCPPIPGRAERLRCGEIDVLLDYAHSSDGMEKLFQLAKQLEPNNIYTVFGCAGQRDRGDRQAMARIARENSKEVFFAADNPRSEDWKQICGDLEPYRPSQCHWDRSFAIEQAWACCQPGDLLLILGKGHEDYQVLDGRSIHFSDKEVLRSLEEKRKTH